MPTRNSVTSLSSSYSIIIPEDTLASATNYLQALRVSRTQAGVLLHNQLQGAELLAMTTLDFMGKLFDTKKPQIFAEITVVGDGSDWNLLELGFLGDISVAVPVTIYDDGNHNAPTQHEHPFSGMLVFTPGALLCNGQGYKPPDLDEVTFTDGQFSTEGYYNLYKRRLLPVLKFINDHTGEPRSAFVTVPGLGCGQFAGTFYGQLGIRLQGVLQRLLKECGSSLKNLKCVYFDPYGECENFRSEIQGISFMVRPLRASGNKTKSQLCPPVDYEEKGDDFSECKLYSIVAWDHVSWPGNDFFIGSRATDDGVKAAATNSMSVLTNLAGEYDSTLGKYQAPKPFLNWKEVVDDMMRNGILRLWDPSRIWQSAEPL